MDKYWITSNAYFVMYVPFGCKLRITKFTFSVFLLFSDFRLVLQTYVPHAEFRFWCKIKIGDKSLRHVKSYREEGN